MPDYKQLIRRKIATRKIGQEKSSPRKLPSKAVFLLVLGGLSVAAILGGRTLLARFSLFKIKQVSVIDHKGKPVSDPQDFFRLDLDKDFNLFSFDMKSVVEDIQARHPQLSDVIIHKQFPDKILIKVLEKKPVAIVALRDSHLADETGFILPFKSMHKDLPEIVGIHPKQIQLYTQTQSLRLKKALKLLRELKKARIYPQYKVSQIDVRQYSDLVFYLEDRIEVRMGQGDFARKAALLSKILAQLKASDTVPKYIDMRFENPSVLPRD